MPGTRCAVAVCKNSLLKTKNDPELKNVMYHRFPANVEIRKLWVIKCHRKTKLNPNTCMICSEHFTDDDYKRDLQAELLNLPQKRVLKRDAVPSRNLDKETKGQKDTSERDERHKKRLRKELVAELLEAASQQATVEPEAETLEVPVAEVEKQLKEANDKLLQYEAEIHTLKTQLTTCEKENSSLKLKSKALQAELTALKRSGTSRKVIEGRVRQVLGNIFTKNQVELLLNKKSRVIWGEEDLKIGFALRRYLGKKAYLYLQSNLQFPLPAISTLQKHRKEAKPNEENSSLNFCYQLNECLD